MSKNTKVIITGATGAIGTALLRFCIKNHYEAIAIIRPGSERRNQIPQSDLIQVIECEIGRYESLYYDKSLKGCDYFFHLAWNGTFGSDRDNRNLQQSNIEYALEAVKLAKNLECKCFLFAGSQAEYGRAESLLNMYTETNPENEYGIAKLAAGMQTRELCRKLGLRHIYTRILSVYGPGDGKDTMVMSTIHKLLSGEEVFFTPGEQMWDYLYSDDAAKALFLLAQSGHEDKVYCIGCGEQKPLKEYITAIGQIVNPRIFLGIGKLPYRENQVMFLGADITDLCNDTGFTPEVSFTEGVKRMLDIENAREQRTHQ